MKGKKVLQPVEGESKIDLYKNNKIRRKMHNGEWWFSIVDIVEAITDSVRARKYWSDIKSKLMSESSNELSDKIGQLKMPSSDGKEYLTDAANIETIFRIIQSIPSSKAEPLKKWLAKVGFERLEEIKNPELAIKRAITIYRAKGYPDEWIETRITNKASREALTFEWDKRGMSKYISILTDAISIHAFGVNTYQHKKIKRLKVKGQSLRDNMTPIELTLTTLGEQVTTEIIKSTNPVSLDRHKSAAQRGGGVAGIARREIEFQTGQPVVSPTNYLTERQRKNNAKMPEDIKTMLQRLLAAPTKALPKNNNNQILNSNIPLDI